MTSKAPTTSTKPGYVRTHGLQALAHHVTDWHLPGPWSIDLSGHVYDGLYVNLPADDSVAWTSSIVVDSTSFEEYPGYRHYSVDGRLPDTGVRIRLTWIDAGTMQAVSA